MNHWQKLGLPVALGICAAFLNWQSVSRKLEPRSYVAVSEKIEAGQLLGERSLKKVIISHTASVDLQNALIPWSKKEALVNRFAQRSIAVGTLLTQFDVYDSNVAMKAETEDFLYVHQKSTPSYFVNDLVTVRDEEGDTAEGCRILSISSVKDGCNIRLAIDAKRLFNLKKHASLNVEKLEVR